MKTLLFCMLGLGLTACGSSPKGTNGDQDELAMLIGTYTNGSSKGIYTFRFNQETGTAVPLSSAALPNPSYLVPSEDGEFVYAVSEMNDSTAALSSLAFDRETGELRLLNTVPTFGADPCYVATNGREVLTANYSGGTMSVFPLQKDGTLAPADTLFQGSATGPDAIRQATPHIHCTVFSPDGKDAENVLDEKINTAWQGNKGDYITFALKNGAKVDKVAIAFTRDNNLPATFEIQLSGGGGQFLTVYSGTVSEYGKLISYPFKGTTASDLRIVLNDDRVSIAEVKF